MIKNILSSAVCESVKSLYNESIDEQNISIQKTKKEFVGDFTLVVFPLLKISKKSPEDTAAQIGQNLLSQVSEIESFNVVKGFLNIVIKDTYWVNFLSEKRNETNFGKPLNSLKSKYVVEYSSPNTNKPLHLGHIRNNLLGQALADLLQFVGHTVHKVNLINDRGIHICKSMLAWKKWGNGETPEKTNIKGDHFVGKYYVIFENEYKKQINELINKGLSEEEAKKQAPLILEAQELLKLWETGDANTLQLWKKMNSWVVKGFDETYDKMGVGFDKIYFESDTYLLGKTIVDEGLNEGVFFRKEDNSVWIDLSHDGLDEKLLLRSDGTSVYMTQDLGTAELRWNDFKPDTFIYVVGNEQIYHFDVLKRILSKLGRPWAGDIIHFSYGMVELPDGKMKSREGKVVDADDLIEDMINTAQEHTALLGKIDGFNEDEANELYYKLAMGALKYFILKVDPKKNMIFNPTESIDFNGNTGPFIQYSYVRICSLNEKAQLPQFENYSIDNLYEKEKSLLKIIHDFPELIAEAAKNYSPALIANYLYELAKEFNQFYHELQILKEPDLERAALRLEISNFCGKILKSAMKLLGIEMPNRM